MATGPTVRSLTRRLRAGGVGLLVTGGRPGSTGLLGSGPSTDTAGTEALPARLRLEAVSTPDCEAADPLVLTCGELVV
jgi:hypothetical protein